MIRALVVAAALLAFSTCAKAEPGDDRNPAQVAHHTKHQHRAPAPVMFGGLIGEMRRYVGGNPTGWAHVWCGRFLDMALRRTGHAPGSALARSYKAYGRPAGGPCVGCIAVWPHHVGVVTAVAGGSVTVISGNDGRAVRERDRSVRGVIAWRMPG